MKDIKDYLHLYIGCEFGTDIYISGETDRILTARKLALVIDVLNSDGVYYCKLLLRPMSSVSLQEWIEYRYISEKALHTFVGNVNSEQVAKHAEGINWLRKKGIDCDGLLPAGLAIDSSLNKPKPDNDGK